MLIGTAFTIVGAILTRWFCKFLDKSKAYSYLFILAGVTTGLVFFVKPENLRVYDAGSNYNNLRYILPGCDNKVEK